MPVSLPSRLLSLVVLGRIILLLKRKRALYQSRRAEGANEKWVQIENRILDDSRGIQFI
jgi:hypothetical protein